MPLMYPDVSLKEFDCGGMPVQLYVPHPQRVQQQYLQQKQINACAPLPYWAQVWPAAKALAQFIALHPAYVRHKNVLEIGAGLGLPSLLAARYAAAVCCTDYAPEAVALAQQSAKHNALSNFSTQVLDWRRLPARLKTDVLLLSDVNYEPEVFEVLYAVLQHFLKQDTRILLSTPQRLLAKPFLQRILSCCVLREEIALEHQQQTVYSTVLVLEKQASCPSEPIG